jgi:hypothetical protein
VQLQIFSPRVFSISIAFYGKGIIFRELCAAFFHRERMQNKSKIYQTWSPPSVDEHIYFLFVRIQFGKRAASGIKMGVANGDGKLRNSRCLRLIVCLQMLRAAATERERVKN